MQFISKKLSMPVQVEDWVKNEKPNGWTLGKDCKDGYEILREQLRPEQKNLCCYCCQALETQVTIEHVKSRNLYPALTYDYNNLLLSCKTPKQCDNAKGNQELDLNPLMIECDIEIKINLAGELESKSTRAEQAITILNLNNPTLCNKRKAKIDMISFTFDPSSADIPIKIMDRENLDTILQAFSDTVEYQEFQYILRKLA